MRYLLITTITLFSFNSFSQESNTEIDPNIERSEKIQDLINRIEDNRKQLNSIDNQRLNKFINEVGQRKALLAQAKKLLADEEARNTRLEKTFEDNENRLSELETELQLKLGVLGELFGVARQMAGELQGDTESAYNFTEFPDRSEKLKYIGQKKVHNLDDLETLWILHLNEIASSGQIKEIEANIINRKGDLESAKLVRYGPFNIINSNEFLKTDIPNNAFKALPKQPERSITKQFRSHYKSSGYAVAPIDPTRGFLLSLYLDKPGWFERIAQGRTIGFIIILIGLVGLVFSAYKIYLLNNHSNNIIENSSIDSNMTNLLKDANSRESKENLIDEYIINYSKDIEWGNNWVKFFAAVAPLLGLLGTVIGMIETFQAITLFGTGDPKQMAGGISQALITTMLGLIVAAPLLGFYTYLSEKASSLIQILEEKASYVLSKD